MDWTLERIEQKRLEWLHKYADIPGKLDAILAVDGKNVYINSRYFYCAELYNLTMTRNPVLGFKAKTTGYIYQVWINAKFTEIQNESYRLESFEYEVMNFLQGEDPMNQHPEKRSNFITPGDWMQLVNKRAEEAEKVIAARESQELKDKAEVMYKRMALEIAKEE